MEGLPSINNFLDLKGIQKVDFHAEVDRNSLPYCGYVGHWAPQFLGAATLGRAGSP